VDDRLKRRLIGAAVLVSLAVIFVPMLVEEDPVPAPPVQGTNIPPRPDLTFKSQILKEEVSVPTDAAQPESPQTPPPLADEPPPVEEPKPLEDAKPVEEARPAVTASRPKATDSVDKDREKPKEKPALLPAPVAKATPPPVPAPAPAVKATPPPKISHWVVQVGNYPTREKAAAVASALKGRGLDAFVENLGGQSPAFRVAVGPEEERRQADALLPKVRSAAPGDAKPFVRPWP
jgi:DedD protein